MSGIIGSKFNHRGSGLVGSLGTDGQHMLSSGAGKKNVFETVSAATYDDEPIKSDLTALAIREATNESSAAFNLPSSFIETFTDDTNLGTETDGDRTSGYWSTTVATGTAFDDDSNTSLLIHSNTTNDSTTFTDSSSNGHTITAVGTAEHKTAQAKFGSSSIQFNDGTVAGSDAHHLSIAADASFDFLAEDFCVEFWSYNSYDAAQSCGQYGTSDAGVGPFQLICNTGGNMMSHASTNNSSWDAWNGTSLGTSSVDNTWHHWAVTRSGDVMGFYKDGTRTNTTTLSTDLSLQANNTFAQRIGSSGNQDYNPSGYMDEIRVSLGVPRYTGASFTVPTEILSSNATGTLIQSANTVTGSRTEVGGTMLYKDNEGTATLGTDLKIYFTADNSAWTEAASYTAITPVYSSGIKMVRLGKTTVTGGTDVRYKAVWANQSSGSKETQLHAIGINY